MQRIHRGRSIELPVCRALDLEDDDLDLGELCRESLPRGLAVCGGRCRVGIDADATTKEFLKVREKLPETTVVHVRPCES